MKNSGENILGRERVPDFLCIGAQRSCTTWLSANLRSHPDVWLPPFKEIHFFDELFVPNGRCWARDRLNFLSCCQDELMRKSVGDRLNKTAWPMMEWAGRFAARQYLTAEWYKSLFAEAPPGALAGEITPAYAILPDEGVVFATNLMPDKKFIFIMRDPVERSISGALHSLTIAAGKRELPSNEAFLAALDDEQCRSRSAYRDTIERWERYVRADQIGYFFYDEVCADHYSALKRICGFLGLPFSEHYFPSATRVENNNPVSTTALATPDLTKRLAARHLPDLEWLAKKFGHPVDIWLKNAKNVLATS